MNATKRKLFVITGVAGLLGSRLADWIIENKPNINIIGIDDLSGGFIENINEGGAIMGFTITNGY